MIFWKCSNCETNNLYPKTVECECCGAKMNSNQTESAKRFMFYKQRADEGDSYAIMNMAEFYATGDVFIKDIDKALEMMTDAANRGNADAQQKLADWYFFEGSNTPAYNIIRSYHTLQAAPFGLPETSQLYFLLPHKRTLPK